MLRAAVPFARNSCQMAPFSAPFYPARLQRCGCIGRYDLNVNEWIPYSSVSGTCSPTLASLSHSSCFSASSIENRLVPRIFVGSSKLFVVSMISALGLNFRRSVRTAPFCCSLIRSHLFKTMTLANSTWSQSKCEIVLSSSASACHPLERNESSVFSSRMKDAPSTTVTMVSSCATSERFTPLSSLNVKVPLQAAVQIYHLTRSASSQTFLPQQVQQLPSRSSRRVQQCNHWKVRSYFLLSVLETHHCLTELHQCFISPISFTIIATRKPCRFWRTCVIKVVFPRPRNLKAQSPGSRLCFFKSRTSSSIFFDWSFWFVALIWNVEFVMLAIRSSRRPYGQPHCRLTWVNRVVWHAQILFYFYKY